MSLFYRPIIYMYIYIYIFFFFIYIYIYILLLFFYRMEPRFRTKPEGGPNMCDSLAALKKKEENKKKPWSRALSPDKVLEAARRAVRRQGEDPSNKKYVLGQHEMQFGVFKG